MGDKRYIKKIKHRKYNADWKEWLDNNKGADPSKVLEKGRELMMKYYNIEVEGY